jgi:hypothetical protein
MPLTTPVTATPGAADVIQLFNATGMLLLAKKDLRSFL